MIKISVPFAHDEPRKIMLLNFYKSKQDFKFFRNQKELKKFTTKTRL